MKLRIAILFTSLILSSSFSTALPLTSAPVPQTGQASCWDTSGVSIPCAGTGQDGELQAGTPWPNPRFVANADQTVTDKATGLIWSKDANPAAATKTWQQALDYIKALNTGNYKGHNDWRLPNINELKSLVNLGQPALSSWLNLQGFSNVQPDAYWASTLSVSGPNPGIVYMN